MAPETLVQLLRGGVAHVDSVACVASLDLDLSGRHLGAFPHTIWRLVGHMNYWMEFELQRLAGQGRAYPEHASESWPTRPGPAGPAEWSEAVEAFRRLLERLREVAASGDEVLSRRVTPVDPRHGTYGDTVAAVLWETVAHNSYHVGQVVVLRQAFGSWPPPGGGDTW